MLISTNSLLKLDLPNEEKVKLYDILVAKKYVLYRLKKQIKII